jgi:RNA polymerase sigma-70 factor (ECF subfamily)
MDQQEEFLQLFLRHQADLRAFIGSLVRDRHARDDLLQQTALTLWQQLARYDRARSFGAWARGIAAKKVMHYFDKVRRVPAPFSPEVIRAVADAYERTEDGTSTWSDALEHCLQGLPDKSRQLLTLRYQQDLKLQQIAQAVQATLEGVHKALARLRVRLQKCIERRLATAP